MRYTLQLTPTLSCAFVCFLTQGPKRGHDPGSTSVGCSESLDWSLLGASRTASSRSSSPWSKIWSFWTPSGQPEWVSTGLEIKCFIYSCEDSPSSNHFFPAHFLNYPTFTPLHLYIQGRLFPSDDLLKFLHCCSSFSCYSCITPPTPPVGH